MVTFDKLGLDDQEYKFSRILKKDAFYLTQEPLSVLVEWIEASTRIISLYSDCLNVLRGKE